MPGIKATGRITRTSPTGRITHTTLAAIRDVGEVKKDGDVLSINVDDLGKVATVTVDPTVYTTTAIFKAAYWHTERFYIFLSKFPADPQRVLIEFRPKTAIDDGVLEAACREFCNSLIDFQVRQDVIAETGEIRDALVKKAFGEGRKHLDPTCFGSNESRIPETSDEFEKDSKNIRHLTGTD